MSVKDYHQYRQVLLTLNKNKPRDARLSAFIDQCRAEGSSYSDAIREGLELYRSQRTKCRQDQDHGITKD